MSFWLQVFLGLIASGIIFYFAWLCDRPIKEPTREEKDAYRQYLRKSSDEEMRIRRSRKYWYER
jgi:hypothetical protein